MLCKDDGVCAIFNGNKICVKRELKEKKKENNPQIGIEMGAQVEGPSMKPVLGCGKTPRPPKHHCCLLGPQTLPM